MGSKTSKSQSKAIDVKPVRLDEVKLDDLKELESFNPGQYVWVNRYIKLIEEMRKFKPSMFEDDDIIQAINANYMQMCQDQKFSPSYPFIRRMEIENIDPRNELRLYKLVRILDLGRCGYMGHNNFTNNHYFELIMHTVALIELKIDTTKIAIKDGAFGGPILLASELKPTEKYIVRGAYVTGVQFIGPANHVKEMYEKLKNNELSFVSNFDIHFKYKLGSYVEDPSFGLPGIGCVQGIHAFIDKREAIKYLKTGFSGIDLFCPTIGTVDLDDRTIEHEQAEEDRLRRRKRAMEEYKHLTKGMFEKHQDEEIQCDQCKKHLWSHDPIAPFCQHRFHFKCLGKQNLKNNTCPICKSKLY